MVRLTLKKRETILGFYAFFDTHACQNQIFIGSTKSQESVSSEETKHILFKLRF